MVLIRFPNADEKLKALSFLPGRFSFTSWATGEILVAEAALPFLKAEAISFAVESNREVTLDFEARSFARH